MSKDDPFYYYLVFLPIIIEMSLFISLLSEKPHLETDEIENEKNHGIFTVDNNNHTKNVASAIFLKTNRSK